MNHYINLLEDSEKHYLSAAQTNPLYKLGAVAALVVILAAAGAYYYSLTSTASMGEELRTRWREMEGDVEAATERNNTLRRLQRSADTLRGWSDSRFVWDELLTDLVNLLPVPLTDVQFTQLAFDERMEGVRNRVPGNEPVDYYPLKRRVELSLRGRIRSGRPERVLGEFQRNLLTANSGVLSVFSVNLDNYVQVRDEDGRATDLSEFVFTLVLEPSPVEPAEPEAEEESP